MKKFKFRLATLQRLRENVRDQRRGQLGEAYRADEILQEQETRLEQEQAGLAATLREAAAPGEIEVDRLLADHRYALLLGAQRQHLSQQRKAVAQEIDRRRQLLIEADRDVRVLENLEKRQRERHREEENRQEIKLLDEVAQRRVAGEDVP
jgi:flagellar protein FliJ